MALSHAEASAPRTIEDLVAEIAARFDELDASNGEAEALGTAPPQLAAQIRELGVSMVKAPHEVGGDQLLLADQFAYFAALSGANATAGWAGFNHAGAAGSAGALLSEAGVDRVFGGDVPLMAAVSAPSGTFREVDGGVVLDGTWSYASGVRHADWVMLTARAADGARAVRLAVVPTSDASIGDQWNVMALKGTGSVDVAVDELFVPSELVIDPADGVRRGGPMYQLGYQAYVAAENLGFTVGVCQRFVDELVTYARGKSRGPDGLLSERGAFQYELARGRLAIDAVKAHGFACFGEVDDALRAGRVLTADEHRRVVAVVAHGTESAVEAVTRLFRFAGAGALFDANVLQRCFRDAVGSAQHHVASNVAFDRFGGQMLTG